jgi:hypothetical protein
VLTGLKTNCPDLRWYREAQVWRGSTAHFVRVLRFCSQHFMDDQIILRWNKFSMEDDYSQLRFF